MSSKKSKLSLEQLINEAELRKQAEKQIQATGQTVSSNHGFADIKQALHELRVYQIELEAQNEELLRVQQQINIERERYFEFYNSAPVGYCTLSYQGTVLDANLTAATLLETTRDGLINQPISRFVHKEDWDTYHFHRKKLRETDETQGVDLRLLNPDGSFRWVQVMEVPAWMEDGTPIYHLTINDITERKQIQEELQRLSSVASQTTNSVIITDNAGHITWVNDGFCRLTGYALEDVLGRKPGTLLQGPDTDPGTVAEMRAALKIRQGFNGDVVNYDKNNVPYWVRISCNPLKSEKDEIQGYISIQSNIDREKKAERLTQERSERATQQRNLIAELSTNVDIVNKPIDDQLAIIAARLCTNLLTDRVSVWMFSETNTQLRRRILHAPNNGSEPNIMVLDSADCPAFFTALNNEVQVDAADAQNDPLTEALGPGYLEPLQIRSLLDTAIQQDGRTKGVLCVEHCHSLREWQDDEKTFLTAIAELIARLCANAERKEAQVAAKEAAALQSVTLNTIVEGIVTVDQNGTIQTCNPALERMFGYPKEDLYGKNIKLLMPSIFAKSPYDVLRDDIHQQSASIVMGDNQDVIAKRSDGNTFPVEVAVQQTRHRNEVLYVASIRDVSELRTQQEKIVTLAYYDPLTGLPNRRLLEERVQELNWIKPEAVVGNALLFIDIDDFKNINDSLGHRTGDNLLQEAGKRISACLSPDIDTLARLGGDEFCVLLPRLEGTESEVDQQAERMAEQILQKLQEPFHVDEDRLTVSASIGISVEYSGKLDLQVRMKRADMAMYEAKKAGKKQACLFSAQMEAQLLWRLKIQADLGAALEEEALTVHYQPIVDESGNIVKLEALVRWQHPTEGWIGPDVFIPIAEAAHLIVPLGNQVLRTVLQDIESWLQIAPDLHWSVAVNISQFQLTYPYFHEQVEQILSEFGFAYGRLVFEVTESTLAEDIEASIDKMLALTALGITFSLDDFGTGYSSLEYLKRLPIETLKIDKSFVDGIPADANDIAIIKSVRSLATEMGLRVVAEGVETAQQFQFLKDLKCDRYQGYYFSKPIPASSIERLLGSGPLP